MKEINFETVNYNRKDELKTFITSFNELIDKYNRSLEAKNTTLQKLKTSIERKKNAINKLEVNGEELVKREEELRVLKTNTGEDIKRLEEEKKEIDYTDIEVMKMEREDIDTLINAKKAKITKIDAKVNTTRDKILENKESKKNSIQELKDLENQKMSEEDSLFKTQSLLKLTYTTKEAFNSSVSEILRSVYIPEEEREETKEIEKIKEEVNEVLPNILDEIETIELPEVDETPIIEDKIVVEEVPNEPEELDLNVVEDEDVVEETVDLDIEDPTLDLTPVVEEVASNNDGDDEISDVTSELSFLDFDKIELPEEAIPQVSDIKEDDTDYKKMIESTFQKEGISYDDFDEESQIKLVENADNALKNLIVLKKHKIPVELTLKQPNIYYDINPQDLEDLLTIITVDEDGNGMGYKIDYTFYILNELAKTNVDKLIDVYNNEFMNVDAKSGLIKLLKLTNPELTDFKNNREANKLVLKSLGVEAYEDIENLYPDFINIDNPLFIELLNLFDKSDLVEKINKDNKIIPKIMEYWKNN